MPPSVEGFLLRRATELREAFRGGCQDREGYLTHLIPQGAVQKTPATGEDGSDLRALPTGLEGREFTFPFPSFEMVGISLADRLFALAAKVIFPRHYNPGIEKLAGLPLIVITTDTNVAIAHSTPPLSSAVAMRRIEAA